jgi:2-polyprenyl-6-methoxyphenol hydroxylase-like FAD-dependent oxidoreductase
VKSSVSEKVLTTFDVIIVGAGPAGLALGNILASFNIRTRVFDKKKIYCFRTKSSFY